MAHRQKEYLSIKKLKIFVSVNELANLNKDKNNIKAINLKHVSIQHFEIMIRYIYGGVVLLDKDQDALFIFELILVASEFHLDELSENFTSPPENALISLIKRDG